MIVSLLLSLAQASAASPPASSRPQKMRLEGDFSCQLIDRADNEFDVSGEIVDYEESEDRDRITIELDAPRSSGIGGTYYGYVNGDAIIFRNFVNYESHMMSDENRWANMLLWQGMEQGGSLIVDAQASQKLDVEADSFIGFCDIDFERKPDLRD